MFAMMLLLPSLFSLAFSRLRRGRGCYRKVSGYALDGFLYWWTAKGCVGYVRPSGSNDFFCAVCGSIELTLPWGGCVCKYAPGWCSWLCVDEVPMAFVVYLAVQQ